MKSKMATLRGSRYLTRFITGHSMLQQRGVSTTSSVAAAWNKDWMPDKQLPVTQDEVERVAAKYNIPPELYRPHADPKGDYPDIGIVSQEKRDANYDWDDYNNRRDFGEFVDLRAKLHTEDRCDPLHFQNSQYSGTSRVLFLLFVMFGIGGFWQWCEKYPISRNFFDSQMPFNNKRNDFVSPQRFNLVGNYDRVKHYTFEPAE